MTMLLSYCLSRRHVACRLLRPGQTSLKLGVSFSVSQDTIGYMKHLFIQVNQVPFGNDLSAEIATLYLKAAEIPRHEEDRALDVVARIRGWRLPSWNSACPQQATAAAFEATYRELRGQIKSVNRIRHYHSRDSRYFYILGRSRIEIAIPP